MAIPLTLKTIQLLREGLGVPAESLISARTQPGPRDVMFVFGAWVIATTQSFLPITDSEIWQQLTANDPKDVCFRPHSATTPNQSFPLS